MDTDNDAKNSVTDRTPPNANPDRQSEALSPEAASPPPPEAKNDATHALSQDSSSGPSQSLYPPTPQPMQRSPLSPNLPLHSPSPPLAKRGSLQSRRRRGLKRLLRYGYYRFIRLHSSPDYLARGLAIGVFSGFLPFFGLQVILSVAIASLLRGHRVVAAAATWISNPLTYIPLYSLGFHLGRWMLGSTEIVFTAQTFQSTQSVMALGSEFAITLLTGCITLGLIFASISYVASLYLLKRARRRRGLRRQRNHR